MAHGKVAVLVENDYQDMEVWVPLYRLREEGYEAIALGPEAGTYKSKHGYPVQAQPVSGVRAEDFRGVVIPGGWAPDRLRQHESILRLVRDLQRAGRPSLHSGGETYPDQSLVPVFLPKADASLSPKACRSAAVPAIMSAHRNSEISRW